jgi:hypothetical protein
MNLLKFNKLIKTEKMLNEHELYINRECCVIYEVVQEKDSNKTKRLPIIPILIERGKKEVKFYYDEKIKREFELIEKIATTLAQEMLFKYVVINISSEMKDKMEDLGYKQVESKTFSKEI